MRSALPPVLVHRLRTAAAAVAVLATAAAPAAAQPARPTPAPPAGPAVGVTGAVNPQATGTPPAQPARALYIGADLVMRERIRTGSEGTVQVLFVDRSTLSIGRDSEVVIDEFVFNPATDTGRMAATLTRGALRFVGGRVSHRDGVRIETPSGTIGIRGGTAMITVTDNVTRVLNIFGNTVLSTPAGSVTMIRPGFISEVRSRLDLPGAPRQASVQEIAAVTGLTASGPGQTGGAPTRPGDIAARNAGVGQQQAGLQAQQVQPLAPQGNLAQPLSASNLPPGGPNPNLSRDQSQLRGGQVSQQNQLAQQNQQLPTTTVPTVTEPFGFPDGIVSLGDLRGVNVPLTLTYSQANVPLFNSIGFVGTYDFAMQVTLNANPALRGINATAVFNVPTSPLAWPYPALSNVAVSTGGFLAAPNYGGVADGAFGFGVSTTCAVGVDCGFGFQLRNQNGRIARAVDHNGSVWTPSGPAPPAPGPTIATGSGTALRP